jgi:hypothetical protein
VINAYAIYCLVTTQLEANHALIINTVLKFLQHCGDNYISVS